MPLGKVKVYAKKTVAQLSAILEELKDIPPLQFSEDFSHGASALLDDLLG